MLFKGKQKREPQQQPMSSLLLPQQNKLSGQFSLNNCALSLSRWREWRKRGDSDTHSISMWRYLWLPRRHFIDFKLIKMNRSTKTSSSAYMWLCDWVCASAYLFIFSTWFCVRMCSSTIASLFFLLKLNKQGMARNRSHIYTHTLMLKAITVCCLISHWIRSQYNNYNTNIEGIENAPDFFFFFRFDLI